MINNPIEHTFSDWCIVKELMQCCCVNELIPPQLRKKVLQIKEFRLFVNGMFYKALELMVSGICKILYYRAC